MNHESNHESRRLSSNCASSSSTWSPAPGSNEVPSMSLCFRPVKEIWNTQSSCFVEPKALITLLHDLAEWGIASDRSSATSAMARVKAQNKLRIRQQKCRALSSRTSLLQTPLEQIHHSVRAAQGTELGKSTNSVETFPAAEMVCTAKPSAPPHGNHPALGDERQVMFPASKTFP
jgi:hypothetical protein